MSNSMENFSYPSKNNGMKDPEKLKGSGEGEEGKETWSSVLYDFTQNTTIHGLRQITEPTPFTLRRVVWVFILLGGIVLFIYQLISSVLFYLSWPVAVNVKINYNETLRFPAVTICNQNAFRSTVTARAGMYHLLTDLYTHQAEHGFQERYGDIAANMSTEDIFVSAAHDAHDLIVSCEWDRQPCGHADFVTTLTDHGVCYTFNSGHNQERIHNVTKTGANHGLRLRVNIEQYEYMSGPNEGAGLKILLHDQFDQPLVRDLGQAIPPGSHAFVGVQIVQVQNLKPPHGVCNDSAQLEFFTSYTMASCFIDHQQRALRDNCGCRMYYMPPDSHGQLPVCTLEKHLHCAMATLDDLSAKGKIECPIPCTRNHYDPTITYASNSNFDVAKMLRGNTSLIQRKYIEARETGQRVTEAIVEEDTRNTKMLKNSMRNVEQVWGRITSSMNQSLFRVNEAMKEIKLRIDFHYDRGLDSVEYIIDHDFIRGYEVMMERTLPFVTQSYQEVVSSYKRIMHQINNTAPLEDQATRHLLWTIVDNMLQSKLDVGMRARDNLTKLDNAYRTGEPILTFRKSYQRRYDMSYIALELLHHDPQKQKEYFDELNGNMDMFVTSLDRLVALGYEFVENGTTTLYNLQQTFDKFARACRGYNYRLFQYRDRIVLKSRELIQARVANFLQMKDTLYILHNEMKVLKDSIEQLIETVNMSEWHAVGEAAEDCQNYLSSQTFKKFDLVDVLNSKTMDAHLQGIRIFYGSLRSRAREVSDTWVKMASAYENIYINMLTESSTKKFYAMINEDVMSYVNNASAKDYYIPIFAYMLRKSGSEKSALLNIDPKKFITWMNADFKDTVPADKQLDINNFFQTLSADTNIMDFVGDTDEQFFKSFHVIQSSLSEYSSGNLVNYDFYRQNFMQVDVFMRELSYEEITQQVAYDMTNLWSDIGGSIGLFIGASMLSVFEIVDIFIHSGMKMKRQEKKAKNTVTKPEYASVPVSYSKH